MLSRRAFLRASSLVAAGAIAADQLEILDRLAPRPFEEDIGGWGSSDTPSAKMAMIADFYRRTNTKYHALSWQDLV